MAAKENTNYITPLECDNCGWSGNENDLANFDGERYATVDESAFCPKCLTSGDLYEPLIEGVNDRQTRFTDGEPVRTDEQGLIVGAF